MKGTVLPLEEKDEPLYRRPRSEEDLVPGVSGGQEESGGAEESPEPARAPEHRSPASYPAPSPEEDEAAESRGVVVSLLAPDATGDYVSFVSLPGRLLIVEEQEGDSDLGVFADAVDKRLASPYRARALRADGSRFAMVADEIETIRLLGLEGDELVVFAMPDGQRTAALDGNLLQPIPVALDSILSESAPCLLTLTNVDEDVWEVSVELL